MKSWPMPDTLLIFPNPTVAYEAVDWGATRQSTHESTSENCQQPDRTIVAS
jgi:hypothetical protein